MHFTTLPALFSADLLHFALAIGSIVLILARESFLIYIMTQVALNNLLTYLQGLQLTQRNRQWLAERLIEPKAQNDAHTIARSLCSPEEYAQFEEEGFLSSPQMKYQPHTDDEIIAELRESHASGYLSGEASEEFMQKLEAL